jgi:type II secretory pathway pseudopilin PulG
MGDQTKDLQQQQQQQQLQQQQQQQQLQQQQLQQLGPTISMQEYQNVSIPSSQQVSHNRFLITV